MHPVLFSLGGVPVHSYYILWTAALTLAVFWTKRRLLTLFALDEDRTVSVLLWGLVGLYVGARLGAVYDQWEYFSSNPWRIVSPWEGGLSAISAFVGAGAGAAWRCHRLWVPLGVVAEAASLPAAVTETLGRWGCFLNGCCYGVETSCPWGVHFPFDAEHVVRHPTQLYYALGELGLLGILVGVERWIGRGSERRVRGAVLWPLFMVGYGVLRWSVDPWRHENVPELRLLGFVLTGTAALAGGVWLAKTWWDFRAERASGSGTEAR